MFIPLCSVPVLACVCAMHTPFQRNKDKAGLKQLALKAGYQSKYFDENVIFNMTRFALDTDGPEVRFSAGTWVVCLQCTLNTPSGLVSPCLKNDTYNIVCDARDLDGSAK